MIKTKVFRMNRSSFIKEMTWLYGMPWIAAATAFVLISVIFSFIYDLRWTIVTLMIIFIIMPMIIAFFYIYHGLKPLSVVNAIPHTLSFSPDEVYVSLLSPPETIPDNEHADDNAKSEPELIETASRHIPYSRLGKYKTGTNSVIFPIEGDDGGFLWIPLSAFEKDGDMADAIKIITDK